MQYEAISVSVADGEVQLRLTSKGLITYAKEMGLDRIPPLAAVISALDSVEAKCALFTAAMRWPGHQNEIKKYPTGEALMDALLLEGWDFRQMDDLVVDLAKVSGLAKEEDAQRIKAAHAAGEQVNIDRMVAMLKGEVTEAQGAEAAPDGQEENPMTAAE